MRRHLHSFALSATGAPRELQSLHFGHATSGKKVYLQASLHADEIPGMLVAHYLRELLGFSDAQDEIDGEIVLVPIANPIGLDQEVLGQAIGRFDLANGMNFNRGYLHLTPKLIDRLPGKLGPDLAENTRTIRALANQVLEEWQPTNDAGRLKKTLQRLAADADIVLDLHCDNQAMMHVYTGTPLLEASRPLAAYLGAHALLVCELSGDDPFDEGCMRHWWELARHFSDFPIAPACLAATVELRGETDVNAADAQADAAAIMAFLRHAGHIAGAPPQCPDALCEPTPLAGVEPIVATQSGVLVFSKPLGHKVSVGESIGEVIDPISGTSSALISSVAGVLFARVSRRYVQRGTSVAKIAGAQSFRTGNLLSL